MESIIKDFLSELKKCARLEKKYLRINQAVGNIRAFKLSDINFYPNEECRNARNLISNFLDNLTDEQSYKLETAMYIGRYIEEGDSEWTRYELIHLLYTGKKYDLFDMYSREQILSKRAEVLVDYFTAYLKLLKKKK